MSAHPDLGQFVWFLTESESAGAVPVLPGSPWRVSQVSREWLRVRLAVGAPPSAPPSGPRPAEQARDRRTELPHPRASGGRLGPEKVRWPKGFAHWKRGKALKLQDSI